MKIRSGFVSNSSRSGAPKKGDIAIFKEEGY